MKFLLGHEGKVQCFWLGHWKGEGFVGKRQHPESHATFHGKVEQKGLGLRVQVCAADTFGMAPSPQS